ncbi:GNAT family N-acetyltransferase [Arthrobacter sp. RCC_34]|uniref:GNAT family N-acetyltransferase n=1 Tax=Arthrobacter sp. RCC_34 TaxID=3239230 RepID=UPI00352426FD
MTLTITRRRDPAAVRRILESLPDWFGDPEAVTAYAGAAAEDEYLSFCVERGGVGQDQADQDQAGPVREVVGIALVRRHFPESAELHLIAVSPEVRSQGAGRELVEHISRMLSEDGCLMLTVHTVGPSFPHEPYAQTRAFYRRLGFIPLEEHENLDWPGPTLILVRPLGAAGA